MVDKVLEKSVGQQSFFRSCSGKRIGCARKCRWCRVLSMRSDGSVKTAKLTMALLTIPS